MAQLEHVGLKSSHSREIRMDQGLVDYFIAETNKKFDAVGKRFDHVDAKLDDLFAFKWRIVGGSIVASIVVSALFNIALALFGHR